MQKGLSFSKVVVIKETLLKIFVKNKKKIITHKQKIGIELKI